MRLSYRLDALRGSRAEVEELNRRLRVEMATLKSLAHRGQGADRLGMVAPRATRVRLAREFVLRLGRRGRLDRPSVVAEHAEPRDIGVR